MARERFSTSDLAGLPADIPELAPVVERITGPYPGGWYLATYVVAVGRGYIGYSKVCAERPEDVFECQARAKIATPPTTEPAVALRLSAMLGEFMLAHRQREARDSRAGALRR